MGNSYDHDKLNAKIRGSTDASREVGQMRDHRRTVRSPCSQGIDRTVVSAVPETFPNRGFQKGGTCLKVTLSCGHYHRRYRAGALTVGMTVACAFCKPDEPST